MNDEPLPKMEDRRFCVDCRWFYRDGPACAHPKALHRITGKPGGIPMATLRSNGQLCGVLGQKEIQ